MSVVGGAMSFDYMFKTGILQRTGTMCDKHGEYKVIRFDSLGEIKAHEFCMECAKESLELKKRRNAIDETIKSNLVKSFHVFYRESMIVPDLKHKGLNNFKTDTSEDKKALAFARRTARDYKKGTHEGNTLIAGSTGVGKSHLALGIAKEINNQFKTYSENGSVIFMPVASLISKVKNSFDGRGRFTEDFAKKLLTSCDYLVLDDLGKESTSGNELKSASSWVYQFLFDILDKRQKTIITTNFNEKELKMIYDEALVDRIKKGADAYTLKLVGESKR